MKVTECCGVYSDPLMEDYGICPLCLEHCEFVEEEEEIVDQNKTENQGK